MGQRLELTRSRSNSGHFSDDVTFASPVAQQIMPESGAIIHGKKSLRNTGVRDYANP
jgi:hypothetical protein